MNQRLYGVVASAFEVSGLLRLSEERWMRSGTFVIALHRILPRAEAVECYNPHLSLTPESLDAFIALAKSKGKIVSLQHAVERLSVGGDHSDLVFALTFDDGWEDNYRFAWPVIRKHSVPGTIFLATDLVESNSTLPEERLWRAWQAAKAANGLAPLRKQLTGCDGENYDSVQRRFKLLPIRSKLAILDGLERESPLERGPRPRFMRWEEVRQMRKAGIEFGSHTLSHSVLTAENDSELLRQLRDSKIEIEQQLQTEVSYLAYPNGFYDDRVIRVAQQLGYRAAVTTNSHMANGSEDVFRIPRVALDDFVVNGGNKRFSSACSRLHLLRAAQRSNASGVHNSHRNDY